MIVQLMKTPWHMFHSQMTMGVGIFWRAPADLCLRMSFACPCITLLRSTLEHSLTHVKRYQENAAEKFLQPTRTITLFHFIGHGSKYRPHTKSKEEERRLASSSCKEFRSPIFPYGAPFVRCNLLLDFTIKSSQLVLLLYDVLEVSGILS